MKKALISFFACALLLGLSGIADVQAASGSSTTNIGYTADHSNMDLKILGETEIIKGTAGHQYTLNAYDKEIPAVWTIKGATSKKTFIDAGGFLNVGVDETATEIEIIAYSTENPDMFETHKVKLIEKTYTVVNVEKKNDISMPYGTTEKQLLDKLEKYDTFQVTLESNDGKTYVIYVDQALIHREDDIIQENGIVRKGSWKINYDLVLPYIQIDYDGTVYTDVNKETNITGDATTSVMVTITGDDPVPPKGDTTVPSKGGKTSPKTGDTTDTNLYIVSIAIAVLAMFFMLIIRKKKRTKNEVKNKIIK